jgi:thiol-disulfide isomerase/thioredoxin
MSNRPTAKDNGFKPTAPQSEGNSRALWIGIGVAAVVILAAIGLAAATEDTTDETSTSGTAGAVSQNARILGDALPAMPDAPGIVSNDAAVGTAIPTVEGKSFDGSAVTIKSGERQLLIFAAHWCPHCQNEIPKVVQWRKSDVIPRDIKVTLISTYVIPERGNYPPASWLTEAEFKDPTMADTTSNRVAHAFGVAGFPTLIAVNADGTVAMRGSAELGQTEIEQLVAATKG